MRAEKVDTRAVLNGDLGDANFTDPRQREGEAYQITNYWSSTLIERIKSGDLEAPPWRLLLDPTHWPDVSPGEVWAYVDEFLARGQWPSLDGLRRRFGRVSNHRSAGEVPEQESLI